MLNARRMSRAIGIGGFDLLLKVVPATVCAIGMYLAIFVTRIIVGDHVNMLYTLLMEVTIGAMIYIGLTLWINRKVVVDFKQVLLR